MSRLSAGIPVLFAMALVPLSSAVADEIACRGSIGARTLDNVRVPQDARCNLNGTRVQGTITVQRNATLVAQDVIVIGNVQGENARNVRVLEGSRVGGDVQVVQGGGAAVADSRVDGDILYDENRNPLYVVRNVVGGNVQAFQNRGGVDIRRNRIDGNLQCKANVPAPEGGGNIVQGNKEDQCRGL